MGTWKSADGTRKPYTKEDREEARARLLRDLKPGDTLFTILRHCSRSGMRRRISLVKQVTYRSQSEGGTIHRPDIGHYDYSAAAVLGNSTDGNGEGIIVHGCGMDMGFHLVSSLSRALWPDGFGCIGAGCPSNDHANGDRDYTKHTKRAPHWHNAGDYALQHRWM